MSAAVQNAWPIHTLICLICLAGFAALALAMERHQHDVLGRMLLPRARQLLRASGWLGLLLALWLAVTGLGWSFGLAAYSGHTSVAAGAVFITLLVFERIKQKRHKRAPKQGHKTPPLNDA